MIVVEPADSRYAETAVKGLTAIFILSLWVLFLLWAMDQRATVRSSASRVLERQRVAAEAQVNGVFKTAEIFIVAADRWVSEHPDEDPRSSPQFRELVLGIQRVTDRSMLVRLVSESGELFLIPDEGPHKGVKVDDRDYFVAAMAAAPGKLFIGTPLEGRATGRRAVPMATRLSRPSHGVTVIFVGIEISLFNRVFDAIRSDSDPIITLARRDGILLARSATRPVDLGISLAQSPVFTQGLAASPTGVLVSSSPVTDQVTRLVAYGEMNNYPMVMIAGESIEAIDAPWWLAVRLVGGALLLVTLAILASTWRSLSLLAALRASREELSRLASTDELTGLMNRREFLRASDEEVARARRYAQKLAFLELDLDNFKEINDSAGHAAGDAVLREFAVEVGKILRDIDSFGRLGGEEFGILLPHTDTEGAIRLAERVVAAVAASAVASGETRVRFTTSVGVSALGPNDANFEDLFARADKALYEAKAAGRNCVRTNLPIPGAETA